MEQQKCLEENFGKSCEEISWNHRTATPHRSEASDIVERAVCRVKEGTSAVLYSRLDEKWPDSMKCYYYLQDAQNLLADGKSQNERRSGASFKGPIFPFGALVGYLPNSERQKKEFINSARKYYQESF